MASPPTPEQKGSQDGSASAEGPGRARTQRPAPISRRRRLILRRTLIDAALAAAALILLAVVVLRVVTAPDESERTGDAMAAAAEASEWIATNAAGDATVFASATVRPQLILRGISADRVLGPGDLASTPSVESRIREIDYAITSHAAGDADEVGVLGSITRSSVLVARFGHGSSGVVDVHAVVPTVPASSDMLLAALERQRSGAELAGLPDLVLSPTAAETLTSGAVDQRVMTLLADLARDHRLGVTAFPAVAGEDAADRPRRQVEIATVDGVPAAASAPSTLGIVEAVRSRTGRASPSEVVVGQSDRVPADPIVRVRYDVELVPPSAEP